MNNFPLVSVIFITYNRIELLKQTLNSFLRNTDYPNLELILCDDGSPKEIQEEMRKLPFHKYLFDKKNRGIGYNTNKGLLAAEGEFILQLQDDWVINGPSDYLLKGIEALSKISDLGLIRYRIMQYEKFRIEKVLKIKNELNVIIIDEDELLPDDNRGRIYSDTPHLKKKIFHQKIGYYRTNLRMEATELEFCDRVANQNIFKVGFILNYQEIFIHIGEAKSFRTNTIRNRVIKKINQNKLGRIIYDSVKKYLKRLWPFQKKMYL